MSPRPPAPTAASASRQLVLPETGGRQPPPREATAVLPAERPLPGASHPGIPAGRADASCADTPPGADVRTPTIPHVRDQSGLAPLRLCYRHLPPRKATPMLPTPTIPNPAPPAIARTKVKLSWVEQVDRSMHSHAIRLVLFALVANTIMAQAFFNYAGRILVLGGVNLTGLYLNVSSIFSTFAFSLFEIAMLWARQEVLSLDESHQAADRREGLAAPQPRHARGDLADQLLLADRLQRRHLARHPRAGHPRAARTVEVLPPRRLLHRHPLPGRHRRRAGALRAGADDDDGPQAHPAGARRPRRAGPAADPRDDRPRASHSPRWPPPPARRRPPSSSPCSRSCWPARSTSWRRPG